MEYLAGDGMIAYTAAGDMKLDLRRQHTGAFNFPSCHYHGLTVAFDLDIISHSLSDEVKDFPVTPDEIIARFSLGAYPRVLHKVAETEHIFSEMYRVPEKIRIPYFKVKILELLLYLDAMTIPENEEEHPYFYRTQVEKVKAIKGFLTEHLSENYTQEELSRRFDIPMTPMKTCFRSVYGEAIGTLPVALALANSGKITSAQAALAVMLSISMVGSLAKLEVFSENMRQVKFTVENLEEFLEMPELPEPDTRAAVTHTDVELKNVHFSYTGDPADEVLHGIDLKLPEGGFTALVGPSGGGKSTVAKLIARFWDVTSGEITIGGVNVKDMPISQLCEYVSFVTQDNFLFRCSLLENIRLGNPNATDAEVKAAAKAAQCEEFIAKLPQGYDTPAGEAGKRLSGGEKQRIAIARMMLKNAPIVILDEATAFTDPENEEKIQRSIAALTKGKTLLVIAHRLSTIRNADKIVVLKNGNIVAEGSQEQLLDTCPLYRDMWQAHIGAKNWAVSSAEKEA